MAPSRIVPSENLIGPYERWVYGPGKPFTLPDSRFGQYRHVSSIIQLQSPRPPSELTSRVNDDNAQRIWLHSYWGKENKSIRLSYFPFALMPVDNGRVALSYDAIAATLSSTEFFQPVSVLKSLDNSGSKESENTIIAGYRINLPVAPDSFDEKFDPAVQPTIQRPAVKKPRNPRLTIVGVIDDGIPFAHCQLRDRCGKTRVERVWLQDASLHPDPCRRSVLYGRELKADEIDALIAGACGDEDAVYRASGGGIPEPGRPRPVSTLASHGANVIDQIAGCGLHTSTDEKEAMEDVRVIAVQLSGNVTLDTSGFGKEAHILAAMHYIFIQADTIAAEYGYAADETAPPLVVNFSYGFTGGPHDGLDRIERAMCELIGERRRLCGPTGLIVPSGNTFHSRLNGVIENIAFDGGPIEVRWRIQPDDRTSNYCEIWLSHQTDISQLLFQLISPSGNVLADSAVSRVSDKDGPARVGDPSQIFANMEVLKDGQILGMIGLENFDSYRWRLLFSLAPSEPEEGGATTRSDGRLSGRTEPGVWTIRITKADTYALPGPIECRIQRDLDPVAYRYGARQSYFEDSAYALFDQTGKPNEYYQETDEARPFIRRRGTINGIATHKRVLVAGGFYEPPSNRRADGSFVVTPAPYAAAAVSDEPMANDFDCLTQNSPAVHVSVSTERSHTVSGITAGGTRSGSHVTLSGTSAAAPFIARQLALAFQKPENRKKSDPADNYLSLLSASSVKSGDFLRLGHSAFHRQYRQW